MKKKWKTRKTSKPPFYATKVIPETFTHTRGRFRPILHVVHRLKFQEIYFKIIFFSFVSRNISINSDSFFFYWFFSDWDVWIHGLMVYTFLLVSTLGIIFFAIFFCEPSKVPTKKAKWFLIISIEVLSLTIIPQTFTHTRGRFRRILHVVYRRSRETERRISKPSQIWEY